jgi:signal transduction histidine kinase
LEDILVIGRGLANKKGQTVMAEIQANLPPLHADPVRFKQILFNLLSNAVKFTPEGGTISVRARRAPGDCRLPIADCRLKGPGDPNRKSQIENRQSGEWLEIAVTDTGVGIRAEDLPRLFQEFVQLETTARKRHEGTGLGLALTKRLVELHGGRIWAESEGEGRGSTFTFVLPCAGAGS